MDGIHRDVFCRIIPITAPNQASAGRPLWAGVAGVMRGWLIAQFEKHKIAVHIRGVSLEELKIASELFICNSVLGVIPVTRVHAGSLTTEPPVSYQRQHYARMAQTWLREKLGI